MGSGTFVYRRFFPSADRLVAGMVDVVHGAGRGDGVQTFNRRPLLCPTILLSAYL